MKKILYNTLFIILFFSTSPLKGDVKLPAIISDNMVLQQKATVNIWGKARPSEKIKVSASWSKQVYTTLADQQGKWILQITTPTKSTLSHSLYIVGDNKLVVNNILVGEVWLCSGQSNMAFPVAKAKGWHTGILNEEQEMKDADYPEIRLFQVAQKLSPEQPLDDCQGQWMICNAENLKTFSAVAFFFGRNLYKNIQTPIGLIHSSWGGTHAESWTKASVIEHDPIYSQLIEDQQKVKDNYPQDLLKYEADSANYIAQKEKGNTSIQAPKKPIGIYHNKALSTLWNAMINPIVDYTIKGVIWYQGESNSIRYKDYTQVFSNMIDSWRKEWENPNMPFYFVQIAPHYKQPPQIREAQLNTWQTVKNTGMVVTTDCGDSTDIHPRNKRVVGDRLAYWALAKDYGQKIPFSGPLYKTMKVEANKAILSFDYADNGLTSSNTELKGFMIAGNDKKFYAAFAKIEGNKVIVSSSEVPNPKAVRYGWDKFFRVNFYNGANLPASPFRTDTWED